MIINGRALAQDLNLHTQARINKLAFRPLLVDVVVGDDPASLSYMGIKQRTAQKYGMAFEAHHLPQTSTTEDVVEFIRALVKRDDICGLIVQVPLPKHIDQQAVLNCIPSNLDVDLLNQESSEQFYTNEKAQSPNQFIPPTAGAILHILDSLPEDWLEKKFIVLGRGELVGKPIAYLLKQRGYNVEVVHSQTQNSAELLLSADVIISGVGKSNFITGNQVKEGVIIIDAGTSEAVSKDENTIETIITGDVDFESCLDKAKYITPVPGGVGPLTVAKLLENVVKVAELRGK